MITLIFASWVVFMGMVAMLYVSEVSKALATLWVIILAVNLTMFNYDLDLLASAVLAIYSSVFLLLTLLSMVQTSYEAAAYFFFLNKTLQAIIPIFFFFISLQPVIANNSSSFLNAQTYSSVLWTDVVGLCSDFLYSAAIGLHFMFYKIFISETIAFNVYLVLGLMTAVLVLNQLRKQCSFKKSETLKQNFNLFPQTATALTYVRSVNSFRRQTRRKNNSNVRHRL